MLAVEPAPSRRARRVSVSRIRPSKSKRKARIGHGGAEYARGDPGRRRRRHVHRRACSSRRGGRTAKVPTAARQEESVLAAARAVGAGAGLERFAHGTTVATNALLERRGARTAYVGKCRLRASAAPAAADACASLSACAPSSRSRSSRSSAVTACAGRLGPDGELEPLDLALVAGPRRRGGRRGLPPVRVPRPAHERAVAAELRRRHPGVHVVASHEVAPEFREYERASTTSADAYLAPVAARYLRALASAAREGGSPSRS